MTNGEYKKEIYKEAGILSAALSGAKALAGSGIGKKVVTGAKSIVASSAGKKIATGASIGGTIGAIKGSGNYDASQNDGSFGKSQIGQTLKGALGGAALGGAAGGIAHNITKGISAGIKAKPNAVSAKPNVVSAKPGAVSAKAPSGTASATVTNKPASEGFAARNTTGMSLEDQLKAKKIKATGAKQVIDNIPLRGVASDELESMYIEKVASEFGDKIKELIARIKKLPAAWVNTDPEIRAFIGAVAGAGIGALTLPKLRSAEKALAALEKKTGGNIPLSKITGRAAGAVFGGSAGSLIGYNAGKMRQKEKTAFEMLHEIIKE